MPNSIAVPPFLMRAADSRRIPSIGIGVASSFNYRLSLPAGNRKPVLTGLNAAKTGIGFS
jgi:hypothetical protein